MGKELIRFVVNKDVKGFAKGSIVQGYYSSILIGMVVIVNADENKKTLGDNLIKISNLNLLDVREFNIT